MVLCAVGCAHRQPTAPAESPPPVPPVDERSGPYDMDITFCFDFSRSMASRITPIKNGAKTIDADLREAFASREIPLDRLRVRAIAFSDIYVEGDRSLLSTPFCRLPEEEEVYFRYLTSFRPRSGGDDPESGLDALVLAMAGEWERDSESGYHVIFLWTDASAHMPGSRSRPWFLPRIIPNRMEEITELWHGGLMESASRLLILATPDTEPWHSIAEEWADVVLITFPQEPHLPEGKRTDVESSESMDSFDSNNSTEEERERPIAEWADVIDIVTDSIRDSLSSR